MGLLLSQIAEGTPLLITQATDGVTVFNGEEGQPAPKHTFLLLDNQTLKLAEGSSVIVLTDELTSKVAGPFNLWNRLQKHPQTNNKPNPEAQ